MQAYRNMVEQLLSEAGVRINGTNPWDIQVHDERFFARTLKDKSLGLGESYMAGWWDCARIDELICRLLRKNLDEKIRGNLRALLFLISARLFNRQSPSRAGIIARRHYDLGNDLFFSFFLLSYAGAFRARSIQVWQIVMTRVGTPGQPWYRFA